MDLLAESFGIPALEASLPTEEGCILAERDILEASMRLAFRTSEKLPTWVLLAEGLGLLAVQVDLLAESFGILALEVSLPTEKGCLLAERDLLKALMRLAFRPSEKLPTWVLLAE